MSEAERRGRLVTRLRERQLWTREELARHAGVTPSTITNIEEGRGRARMGTIKKLSEALEVDPLELLHPSAEEPLAGKGEAPTPGPPLPRSREEAAFAIVGRVVADPRGDERYRMVVQWNVPLEERERYRQDLRVMLGDDYLEEEMSPQAAELLATASG